MASLSEKLQTLLEEMAADVVEERVVEYIVREVHNGRKLTDVLNDPYVKNRLNEEKLAHVLENPEVVSALEEEIAHSFKTREFRFLE